jgi:hypothetical protein
MRPFILKLLLLLLPLSWSSECQAFSFRNAPVLAVSIPIFSLAIAVFVSAGRTSAEKKTIASLDLAKEVFEHDLIVSRSKIFAEGSDAAFSVQ